jgi:hypothetical protein
MILLPQPLAAVEPTLLDDGVDRVARGLVEEHWMADIDDIAGQLVAFRRALAADEGQHRNAVGGRDEEAVAAAQNPRHRPIGMGGRDPAEQRNGENHRAAE